MSKPKKRMHVTPQKRREIEKSRSRRVADFLFIISLLAFSVAIVSIVHIEISHTFRGHSLNSYADAIYTQTSTKLASRGTIYDRYSNPIATDVKEYKLIFYLDENRGEGEYVADPEQTTNQIVEILGYANDQEAYDYIVDKLSNNDDLSQTFIGKYGEHVTLAQKEEIEAAQVAGVDYEESLTRYYPYGDFASYYIGYTTTEEAEDGSTSVSGHLGVEGQEDGFLKSNDGETVEQVDNQGVKISDNEISSPDTDGVDIVTTIDPQIQTILQTEMDKNLKGKTYDSAISLVMDSSSGEVLAAYSLPSFDPNKRDITNYVDPLTTQCFEPGSTIKSFTVATAMEEGVWNPSNTNVTGRRTNELWGPDEAVADYMYNITGGSSWGTITWEKGYYFSSNTIMTYVLDAIGTDTYANYMTDTYLFGQAIENKYMNTSACSYNPKYPLDYANTSFGQGMTANVLQIARAYSIFANEGDMVIPHYVKQVIDPTTGEIMYDSENDNTLRVDNVISKETASDMLDLMLQAVYYDEGQTSTFYTATGYRYGIGETKVLGKSGTSQIYGEGGYNLDNLGSSFAGFAPAEDPEIYMYTYVVNAGEGVADAMGEYYTSTVDQTMTYLHGEEADTDTEQVSKTEEVRLESYLGQDLEATQAKLTDKGIKTYVIGTGKITSQYPSANQKISVNQVVYLAGEADYNPDSFKNKQSTEVQDICYLLNYNCDFDGIGLVSEVEIIDNTTFSFTTVAPENITTFDSSVTTRKTLTDVTTNKKGE